MVARVYTSLDSGAPVLTGTFHARLRQVLMACLVNGYGSKPAAGWTVGHQSPDALGFSLGNGDGFINFVSTNANTVQVYIMESITDGSTALAAGTNRRSAGWSDGNSSTERQTFYSSGGFDSNSNPHWVVAADGKTVIMVFGGGTTTSDVSPAFAAMTLYFGRYVNTVGLTGPTEFVALGGATAAATPVFVYGTAGSCLRNPFTGLVDQGVTPRYGAGSAVYASDTPRLRNKVVPSRLLAVRSALMCFGAGLNNSTGNRTFAGQLRGLISEPTLCGSLLSEVLSVFGLSNVWQSRVQPIPLPGGGSWYPAFPVNAEMALFISLDPNDWS